MRKTLVPHWEEMRQIGSPLEKVRARQMIEITAGGVIPCEVPELTQAVLQEAWLSGDESVCFHFLSGEQVKMTNSDLSN